MQCGVLLGALVMVMVSAVGSAPLHTDTFLTQGDERKPHVSTENGIEQLERILKILSALEEIHRNANITLGTRITGTRANFRAAGKRNRMGASEETHRAATAPPVDETGTAARPSDDLADSQTLPGRSFKKSLPQPPKKPNKRVCFWKYCSQN
ncbi:urotensin II-related peptide [Lepisosteus oculatus]|uniref:urotensin II-related peptide n=1 Tax=Lepisosteus oculatus TaxID=7918 RepID=UPI0035F512EF